MIIFNRAEKKYWTLKVILLEFCISYLVGILFAGLTNSVIIGKQTIIDSVMMLDLTKLSKTQMLIFLLQTRVKSFLFIWLFSVTILAVWYNVFYIIFNGFKAGCAIACATLLYGNSGFLRFLLIDVLQAIVYLPAMITTLLISYRIHNKLMVGLSMHKGRMILDELPSFLFLLAVVIIGCFLESYFLPVILNIVPIQ